MQLAIRTAAAVLLVATSGLVAPAAAQRDAQTVQPNTITVRCARYPLKAIIWDRPMPVFLDSLHAVGYSLERAAAIGNRICRDEAYVDDIATAGAAMEEILRTDPPRGR